MAIYRVWTVTYFDPPDDREYIDYYTECLDSNLEGAMNHAADESPYVDIVFAVEVDPPQPQPRPRQLDLKFDAPPAFRFDIFDVQRVQ